MYQVSTTTYNIHSTIFLSLLCHLEVLYVCAKRYYLDKNMAAALESVPEDENFKEHSKWWIEVYETNYQFNKRIPVYGQMTIGELIFNLVKEFGECPLLDFTLFFREIEIP